MVLCVPHGPWKSCAFIRELQETWSAFVARGACSEDEAWLALGEDIALEKGFDVDATLAADPDIMRACSTSKFLSSEGTLVKDRVWFSMLKRLNEFITEWSLSLHCVVHNGLALGIYKSVEEMPIWKYRIGSIVAPDLGAKPAGTTPPTTRLGLLCMRVGMCLASLQTSRGPT